MVLQDLKQVLSYDPATGEFRWLVQRCSHAGKAKAGALAGTVFNGYRHITVFQKRYRCARLAWFFVHGVWPEHMVDHKDGDRLNDRFDNLREATNAQNQCNRKATARTGFKGVHKQPYDGYTAEIKSGGRKYYLGSFKTVEEAVAARADAAQRLHGEFAREA